MKYVSEFTVPEKQTAKKEHILGIEDGGCAMILEPITPTETNGDGCFFVRLQSWDDDTNHPLMHELFNKKVRITVEIID
jgi:hypothetical protein